MSASPGRSVFEPAVRRISRVIGGSTWTRRSFLTRSVVVASALATTPRRFALERGSAYGAICGSESGCFDGFSAFCCTINRGGNFCPDETYVGGWWRADNSAFCRGAARYYIDCNAVPGGRWRCHCPETATCDHRHVACTQFRYGNCNLEIGFDPAASPVVCRVVTCTPPWVWDPACTTTAMVDDRTVSHSAPCLPGPWPSPVIMKWSDLGGAGGPLGPQAAPVGRLPHGAGHYAYFRSGAIYDVAWLGVFAVGPGVWIRYRSRIGSDGVGYPLSDQVALESPRGAWIQAFGSRVHGKIERNAAVCSSPQFGPKFIEQPVLSRWEQLGGPRGALGLPTSDTRSCADGSSTYCNFAHVRGSKVTGHAAIYANAVTGVHEVRGAILVRWRHLGADQGPLGFPTTGQARTLDHRALFSTFGTVSANKVTARGAIYQSPLGTHAVWGAVYSRWHQLGAERSALGYPTADLGSTPDATASMGTFAPVTAPGPTTGGVVTSGGTGTWAVIGSIASAWLADASGQAALGHPIGEELDTDVAGVTLRVQQFETGAIYDSELARGCVLYGPILGAYLGSGGPAGSLGIPLSSIVGLPGGVEQATFQGGTLTYTPGIGVT